MLWSSDSRIALSFWCKPHERRLRRKAAETEMARDSGAEKSTLAGSTTNRTLSAASPILPLPVISHECLCFQSFLACKEKYFFFFFS